ncbi:MAG: hypothetical protein MZV64_42655 [Ignavibacteriales bacterium]|nr:hypothetical protein [Ignavibacteriales bacterium]
MEARLHPARRQSRRLADRRRTLVTQHTAGADASVPGRTRPRPHRRAPGGPRRPRPPRGVGSRGPAGARTSRCGLSQRAGPARPVAGRLSRRLPAGIRGRSSGRAADAVVRADGLSPERPTDARTSEDDGSRGAVAIPCGPLRDPRQVRDHGRHGSIRSRRSRR